MPRDSYLNSDNALPLCVDTFLQQYEREATPRDRFEEEHDAWESERRHLRDIVAPKRDINSAW